VSTVSTHNIIVVLSCSWLQGGLKKELYLLSRANMNQLVQLHGLVTTRVDQNNISHIQVSPTRSQVGPHWPRVWLEPVLSVVTHLADKMSDQHMHTVQTPAKRAD